jgi:glycine oxidase
VFLQQNGTLILWHRQDQADAARFFGLLEKNRRINPSLPAMQEKTGAALQDCEPALQRRFNQAVYLPGEGQLDNRQLLAALVDKLRLGVHALEQPARDQRLPPGEAASPTVWTAGAWAHARSGSSCAAFAARWCASMRPKSRCSAPRA